MYIKRVILIVAILPSLVVLSQPPASYLSFEKLFQGKTKNGLSFFMDLTCVNGTLDGVYKPFEGDEIKLSGIVKSDLDYHGKTAINLTGTDLGGSNIRFTGELQGDIVQGLFESSVGSEPFFMVYPEGEFEANHFENIKVKIERSLAGYQIIWSHAESKTSHGLELFQKGSQFYLECDSGNCPVMEFTPEGMLLCANKDRNGKKIVDEIADHSLQMQRLERYYWIANDYVVIVEKIADSSFQYAHSIEVPQKKTMAITDVNEVKKRLKKKVMFKSSEDLFYKGEQVENSPDNFFIQSIRFKDRTKVFFDETNLPLFKAYYPEEQVLLAKGEHNGDWCLNLLSKHIQPGNPETYYTSPDKKYRINGFWDGQGCKIWSIDVEVKEKKKTHYQKAVRLEPFFYCNLSDAFWGEDGIFYFQANPHDFYRMYFMDWKPYKQILKINELILQFRYNEALEHMLRVVENYPEEESFQKSLGSLYQSTNQNDKAIPIFQKILEKNEGDVFIIYSLGCAYYNHASELYNQASLLPYTEDHKCSQIVSEADQFLHRSLPYLEKSYRLSLGNDKYNIIENSKPALLFLYNHFSIPEDKRLVKTENE